MASFKETLKKLIGIEDAQAAITCGCYSTSTSGGKRLHIWRQGRCVPQQYC